MKTKKSSDIIEFIAFSLMIIGTLMMFFGVLAADLLISRDAALYVLEIGILLMIVPFCALIGLSK